MVDGDAEGSGNLINKICAKAAGISNGQNVRALIFFQFFVGRIFFLREEGDSFQGRTFGVLCWGFFRFFSVHLYAPKG